MRSKIEKQSLLNFFVFKPTVYAGRKVADADPTTDKAGTVESAKPMILREPLGEFDTGLRRRKPFKQRNTFSPGGPFAKGL